MMLVILITEIVLFLKKNYVMIDNTLDLIWLLDTISKICLPLKKKMHDEWKEITEITEIDTDIIITLDVYHNAP